MLSLIYIHLYLILSQKLYILQFSQSIFFILIKFELKKQEVVCLKIMTMI